MILGAATYIVSRRSHSYVDGYAVSSVSTSFSVEASIQPAQPRDLRLLPEGARTEGRWSMFTDVDQTELVLGDLVAHAGGDSLVIGVADWTLHEALPYRLYILGEVGTRV